jgi:hypothetical protein
MASERRLEPAFAVDADEVAMRPAILESEGLPRGGAPVPPMPDLD